MRKELKKFAPEVTARFFTIDKSARQDFRQHPQSCSICAKAMHAARTDALQIEPSVDVQGLVIQNLGLRMNFSAFLACVVGSLDRRSRADTV